MENQQNKLFKAGLALMALLSVNVCMAQRGQSIITLRTQWEHARYTVDVTLPNAYSDRGLHSGTSKQLAVGIWYEYGLSKKWSAETGLALHSSRFNIVRGYDQRYMGSIERDFRVTYPYYRYSLLQLPLRINYRIKQWGKTELSAGATNFFNFTYHQRYRRSDQLSRFYFFSNAVQVHARLRHRLKGKWHIGIEPSLQVYNQWKKDDVLYDFYADFQQPRQPGITVYNKQWLDAVGMALSVSYKL
jgi:hypothetical protein